MQTVLQTMRQRYIWWTLPGAEPDELRVIAQAMDIAAWEDVKALEDEVGAERFREALRQAQPGWFSAKSWNFWHFILDMAEPGDAPPRPVRSDPAA